MDAPAYREYAESQGLPAVLSDAVKTVLLEKPADAKAALIKVLSGNEMPAIKAYYTDPFAPNPQLVDIFAREKGFDLEALETKVNILTADNRKGESLKKNPSGQVPYIELVDGTIVTETICIMEYIEELQPLPTLIGANGKERALTRMWQRRMEEMFVYPTFTAFRFWTQSDDAEGSPFKGFFNGKAPVLIPEAWKGMQEWATKTLKWLEEQKKAEPSDFICGDKFTYVDCQAYTTLKFFRVPGFGDFMTDHAEELPWTVAYFKRLEARPSIIASEAHIKAVSA